MPQLSSSEKELLLDVARRSVRAQLANEPLASERFPPGALHDPVGVFVSIQRGSQLRGCIGRVESESPLHETTAVCAVSAAVSDPRFPPMELGELDDVSFEISVLSKLEQVEAVDRIEVGRHGLLVEMDSRRGLLLPQVASEYGWDHIEFLSQTCMKAGLEPEAWRQGASIFAFEALVFVEGREH